MIPLRPLTARLLPSLAGGAMYGVFAWLWLCRRGIYKVLALTFDSNAHRPPLEDAQAMVMAERCWRAGANVMVPNACMNGGIFNYSPVMLRTLLYPFAQADAVMLGVMAGVLVFITAALLPPARSWGEVGVRVLGVCSGMVAMALEAANIDTVMLTLVAVGALLLSKRGPVSAVGYAVLLFAGAMKFYPTVLLALLLRERARVVVAVGGLVALAGGGFVVLHGHSLLQIIGNLPSDVPFRTNFTAMNLPYGLAMLAMMPVPALDPTRVDFWAAVANPCFAPYISITTIALTAAVTVAGWQLAPVWRAHLAVLDEPRRLLLLAGAMVFAFCFCFGQNFDYRGIFFLLLLPGAAALGREGRVLLVVVLLLMWEGPLRAALAAVSPGVLALPVGVGAWLAREYMYWWLAARCIAMALGFVQGEVVRLRKELRA